VSVRSPLLIYTRLGERELLVGWAWYRPEPQVGDTVRLPIDIGGNHGWQSFRVVGKRFRTEGSPVGETAVVELPTRRAIDLDVEPLAFD
jgi:hypothetical protein